MPVKAPAADLVDRLVLANRILYDQGVAAIFGPGTSVPEAADQVLEQLEGRLAAA